MIGRLLDLEYFWSSKMLRYAEVTSLPVFYFSGTMCKYFENTSIAVSKKFTIGIKFAEDMDVN